MSKKLKVIAALCAVTAVSLFSGVVGCGGNEETKHTYSADWSKDATNHWHACIDEGCTEIDGKAAHAFDEGKVTKEATCAEAGEKVYTCSVCKYEKKETIAKTDEHKFDDGVVTTAPTFEKEGVKTFTCSVCGYEKTESVPKKEHNYSSAWSKDATSHWHACTDDGYETLKKDLATHIESAIKYNEDKTKEYTECTVCGYKMSEKEHTHAAIEGYESDETSHWQLCACGEKMNITAHAAKDDNYKIDETNHWKECVCGAKVEIAAHTAGSDLKHSADKDYHWNECTVCETEMNKTTHTAKDDKYESDDENHWQLCTCGEKVGVAAHEFGSKYTDGTKIYRDCGVCEFTASEAVAAEGISLSVANVKETKVGEDVLFSGTYDYMGLGEYSVGDVLEFKFHGRNIPNVGLFVNKNGVNPIGGGTENTGIFIQTSGHGAITYSKRLYITGPYLIDAGSIEAYSGITEFTYRSWLGANKELAVDVSYEVDGGRFSKFGIEMLDENADYIYRVSTVESATEGKVTIKAVLYSLDGDTPTLVSTFSKEITHYLDSLDNRYAVAYGAGDCPDANNAKHDSIAFNFTKNPTIAVMTEMTLNTATIKESAVDGKTYFSGTYDYMGLGSYELGDTLEFRFIGKNIPNVGLFVNKNGVNPLGGGTENTGLFLQTSGHGGPAFSQRLYVVGPYLLDAGSSEPYENLIAGYSWKNELGKNKELGVKTLAFGINLLDDSTEYVYRITTAASATSGYVKIGVKLYSVAGETETLVYDYDFDRPCYMTDFTNRYAVVYGAGDQFGKAITFSCKLTKAASAS